MKRPYIHVNVAMTADGKIDSVARKGATISSDEDLARVDSLRAAVDAVLVGGRTLLDEDPRLTVKSPALRQQRLAQGLPENPAKVGIASLADISPNSRFVTAGNARKLIFTTARTAPEKIADLRAAGVEVFLMGEDRVDLTAVLATLNDLGVRKCLLEGGGTLIAEFFRLGLADELTIYIAPKIFGGATAPSLADGAGFLPEQALRLRLDAVTRFDQAGGVLLHYYLE